MVFALSFVCKIEVILTETFNLFLTVINLNQIEYQLFAFEISRIQWAVCFFAIILFDCLKPIFRVTIAKVIMDNAFVCKRYGIK